MEFLVKEYGGTTKFCQCKSRNAGKSFWTAGDLNSRGVFEKALSHLENGNHFVFISPLPAQNVNDLSDKARNSSNYRDFFDFQIGGNREENELKTLMRGMSFGPDNEKDKEKVYYYLKRIHIYQFSDDQGSKDQLHSRINWLITGNCEKIYQLLKDFAIENDFFGKEITSVVLWKYLDGFQFRPRNIAKDERVIPKIKVQNESYKQSIRDQGLIHNSVIDRPEMSLVISALQKNKIVFIHGNSGCGKSVLLYELLEEFEKQDILCFVIRLDRLKLPGGTTEALGDFLGLPATPIHCLNAFDCNGTSVMIIDQLDAVRLHGNTGAILLDLTKRLIREAKDIEGNVHIIVSCRTYDYISDPEIKNWIESQQELLFEINLNEFEDSQVREILGKQYDELTRKQQQLFKKPQNLKLWEMISKEVTNLSEIDSYKKLIDAVMEHIQRNIEKAEISINDFNRLTADIVKHTMETGQLYVSARKLKQHSPNLIGECISNGLLQKTSDDLYMFTHQSFNDYFVAMTVMSEIDNGKSLVAWLGDKNKQLLLKRRQLEQVLLLLKDENKINFEENVIDLIQSNEVRFLLKQCALGVLALHRDFTDRVFDFLLQKMNDTMYFRHIINTVFSRNELFVKKLIQKGAIAQWLEKEGTEREIVCNLLSVSAPRLPDSIHELLEKYINRNPSDNQIVLQSLPYDVTEDSENLFALRKRLFESGIYNQHILYHLPELSETHPEWCADILALTLKSWKYDADTRKIDKGIAKYHGDEEDEVKILSIAEKVPDKIWDEIVPQIMRLTNFDRKNPFSDWVEDIENKDHKNKNFENLCIKLVELSAEKIGTKSPDNLFAKIRLMEDSPNQIVGKLYLVCIRFLGSKYADYCLEHIVSFFRIDHFFYFELKSILKILEILLKSFSIHCSEPVFRSLENWLLKYHEDYDKKTYASRVQNNLRGFGPDRQDILRYILLQSLPNNRTSQYVKIEINVLRRKFGNRDPYQLISYDRLGGWVGSKLEPNLGKISDKSWLNIISKGNEVTRRPFSYIQYSEDKILESSLDLFARNFCDISKKFPIRFIKIALNFPDNVHHKYVAAIISTAAETKPDESYEQRVKDEWSAIKIADISLIIKKNLPSKDFNTAFSFFRLIEKRNDENWDDDIIEILLVLFQNMWVHLEA